MSELVALNNGEVADLEGAETYEEDTRWDGSNHISVATGSQWNHETLKRTVRGAYILWSTSQYQGVGSHHRRMSDADARHWLVANGHAEAAEKHFPDAEVI